MEGQRAFLPYFDEDLASFLVNIRGHLGLLGVPMTTHIPLGPAGIGLMNLHVNVKPRLQVKGTL